MTSIDDLLLSGGATGKSMKFNTVGDSYSGTVVSVEPRAYTDIQSGKPEHWDNGDPKMQLVVGIQTDERNPELENDDGVRYDYVKMWGKQKQSLRAAAQAAGGSPAVGDFYSVKFVGEEPSKTRGFNPTKLYEYTIRKANPADALLNDAPPAAQAPAAQAAPTGGLTQQQEQQIATLIQKGLEDSQIAPLFPNAGPQDIAVIRLQQAALAGVGV